MSQSANHKEKRKILVTSALPYANGPIHLGHLVEYIQTDIWVRFQKMRGHECHYVCADDAHGTPIMLLAEKKQTTPEQLIKKIWNEHCTDFADFLIEFDNYYSTHSPENHHYVELMYQRLQHGGYINRQIVTQAYDPEKKMFLPDRFIIGDCPICGSHDQYGDGCESCGSTYSPTDLNNPRSTISGAKPTSKDSLHIFFALDRFEDMLKNWIETGPIQHHMVNKIKEWFTAGLKAWNISRDAPYWGFEIPDIPGKYFYVWLDAPIGYMASFKNYCNRANLCFEDFWKLDSTAELHHFIGKDIAYFHMLFWPAQLTAAGFRKPTTIHCHGFLTVHGQKMSKSRGTFITARNYLDHLDPEYLRYYFATKLSDGIDDIDFNIQDFVTKINSDLVGKLVNIASRTASFITRYFNGILAENIDNQTLYNELIQAGDRIALSYEQRNFSQAMRDVMSLANRINQYINEEQPWLLARNGSKDKLHSVCSTAIYCFKILIIYLKPVLPALAKQVEQFIQIPPLKWEDVNKPLCNQSISEFKPLIQRIVLSNAYAILSESNQSASTSI